MQGWKFGGSLMVSVAFALAVSLPSVGAQTKTVTIQITDSGFTPTEVMAAIDQPIHLHIKNTGHKTHQFSIPYYRIYTQNLSPGKDDDVQFSPWTAGNFRMISDPSGENKPEFSGKFMVVDQK